jgi:hypothetical protein
MIDGPLQASRLVSRVRRGLGINLVRVSESRERSLSPTMRVVKLWGQDAWAQGVYHLALVLVQRAIVQRVHQFQQASFEAVLVG